MFKNSEESKKTTTLIAIAAGLALLLITVLILSTYGVFNNFISYDAGFSPWYMKVIGTIVLAVAAYYAVTVIKDNTKGTAWSGAIVLVLLALGLGFNVNFKFTAGDKQQQETVFYSNGSFQVNKLDKWIEDNKEAYKAHGIDITDTSFINYVKKYSELPGINRSHSLIRLGKQKPSTAPRANESFPLPKELE